MAGDLQLIRKPKVTLAQLMKLDALLENAPRFRRVRLDLSGVKSIDAAALVYMCSRCRQVGELPHTRLLVRFPTSEEAMRVLLEAEFDRFFVGPKPNVTPAGRCVQLKEGIGRRARTVDGTIAGGIQRFLVSLGWDEEVSSNPTEEKQGLYEVVLECLQNVRQHAYPGRQRQMLNRYKWYACGVFDESSKRATVAILDVGVGVRNSLARTTKGLSVILKVASDYLEEATTGLHHASGKPGRGHGLNDLRKFACEATNREFHVMSSGGMVTWSGRVRAGKKPKKSQIPEFEGTIVCLEVTRP